MKTLILAFGVLLSFNGVQAQYSDLVSVKMDNLSELALKVNEASDLPNLDKTWALNQINTSKVLLTQASSGTLESLQQAELEINETSKKIVGRLLMSKKAKLMNRISTLEAMIAQYKTEGLDTEPLETLQAAMQLHLTNLGL
jgi:predicted oxidoreductase